LVNIINRRTKRIFILRPDHLGDLVLFSGALKHIRHQWPDASITLCVRNFGLNLFEKCPHIDRLLDYAELCSSIAAQGRLAWMPAIRGCDRLGDFLRKTVPWLVRRRFACDLVFLPLIAPTTEYHSVMAWIPAKERLGICGNHTNQTLKEDMEWRRIYTNQMDATEIAWDFPELETTRKFLGYLGIQTSSSEMRPEFWNTDADQAQAVRLIQRNTGEAVVGIAPGVSSLPGKKLPPKWYVQAFEKSRGLISKLVFFGSEVDCIYCESILQAFADSGWSEKSLLNLSGRTTVRQTVECYKRCDIMVTQETAAVHMSTALRKPVVGIVGGGHYGRFYPWGDSQFSRVVKKAMDCYGCNWICKYDTVRCIQEIDPQIVGGEILFLLSKN
jgi:ADP-heptose:LPS heptosyltransferase